jgi:hypothetical protein
MHTYIVNFFENHLIILISIIGGNHTQLEDRFLSNCNSLVSIKIANSVTHINDHALLCLLWLYCTSLTFFKIPSNVTHIGSCFMNSCLSLKCINIPSSVNVIN